MSITFEATLLFVVAALLPSLMLGDNIVTFYTAADLIKFSNDVNSGNNYSGTTVLLGADIDFFNLSDSFKPIGSYYDTGFWGSFDGNGYTISNLALESNMYHIGFFGVMQGRSIKNVVLDSTCTVTNTRVDNFTEGYTGGIAGYANASFGYTSFDGCVNMADIVFNGNLSSGLSESMLGMGGIVGYLDPEGKNSYGITNCVNYGSISKTGICIYIAIGGIVGGYINMNYTTKGSCIIENCANYGTLLSTNFVKNDIVVQGGIISATLKNTIENCVNFGAIKSDTDSSAVGNIIGGMNGNIFIRQCFWLNTTGTSEPRGVGLGNLNEAETGFVESNETTMKMLNNWVEDSGFNYTWMMLHLNGGNINNIETETLIVLRSRIPSPQKVGHDFICWHEYENIEDCYEGPLENATDLYASWTILNYTITFDLGNGTTVTYTLTFNDTINYPEIPFKKGLYEWNTTLERMPGYNLTVGLNPLPRRSKTGTYAAIGCAVGIFVVAAVVVLCLYIFVFKKKTDKLIEMDRVNKKRINRMLEAGENYLRIAGADDNTEKLVSAATDSTLEKYSSLYPVFYHIPTMEQALFEAGLDRDRVDRIIKDCEDIATNVEQRKAIPKGLTKEDVAAITMYTYDLGSTDFEYNPYRLINKALSDGNKQDFDKIRGLLFLVMSSLRKLKRVEGETLYRGIRRAIDLDNYKEGDIIMWNGFSSTSPNMKTIQDFIDTKKTDKEENGIASGTLFIIEDGWGYDIQPYSFFPNEREILIEPERCFRVHSVIEAEMVVVKLSMVDTPLLLPELFGEHNSNGDEEEPEEVEEQNEKEEVSNTTVPAQVTSRLKR